MHRNSEANAAPRSARATVMWHTVLTMTATGIIIGRRVGTA
jgi:hypothetical protein